MFRKKTRCSVCGYRFTPKKEDIYEAIENRSLCELFTKPETRVAATDCKRCGCQVMLKIIMPKIMSREDEKENSEETENEDSQQEIAVMTEKTDGEFTEVSR